MCGFTGYFNSSLFEPSILQNMGDAIAHRGPDANGIWYDNSVGIGVCHRRLSIIDLSEAGSQPMTSKSRKYVIAFNGEIYNYKELKKELSNQFDIQWNGHSDTEVILEAFELWGIDKTITKLIGMFAIFLFSKEDRKIFLIRDRAGEKPLYFGWQKQTLFFGSELKSFIQNPFFEKEICTEALADFFQYNYVPSDKCIFKGIKKLKPGFYYELDLDSKKASEKQYWSLFDSKIKSIGSNNPNDIVNSLDHLLKEVISDQLITDVPLGAFLSGGVDSSTIVAIMQQISEKPVKTFSIGFTDPDFDEAIFAKQVAQHLGTDHTELYLESNDALSVIPDLPNIYDEPFSDSSQIPTFLVSKLAKTEVTVSLSGDAGDELFGGYNRYLMASNTWGKLSKFPQSLRKISGKIMLSQSTETWDQVYKKIKYFLPEKLEMTNFGDKIHKAAKIIDSKDISAMYRGLISHWNPNEIISESIKYTDSNLFNFNGNYTEIENMMNWDFLTYLPDDILVKVDRAAMSNSLETRVPLLDHRIIEFAHQLPFEFKIQKGKGKWILREVLYKYVPKELIERPKRGFGIPLDSWLRGPLKEWTYSVLSKENLEKHNLLNIRSIELKLDEHMSGKRNWQYLIWDVLMFQSWYNKYIK
jgi:asparagine synthase (glutamine-hydrolysing)